MKNLVVTIISAIFIKAGEPSAVNPASTAAGTSAMHYSSDELLLMSLRESAVWQTPDVVAAGR
jgi:hypothetical protein